MTVANIYASVAYATDGTTATFAVPFPFFDPADLVVTLYNAATQALTTTVLNGGGATGYTVSGTPDPETGEYPSGSVVFGNAAPVAALRLVLGRATEQTQETSLATTGPLPAKDLEAELDRLTLAVQELSARLASAIQAPLQDIAPVMTLPAAETRAMMSPGPAVVCFDTFGNLALNHGLIGAAGAAGAAGPAGLVASISFTTSLAGLTAAATLTGTAYALTLVGTLGVANGGTGAAAWPAALAAAFAELPTSLPGSAGIAWNNSGVIQLS